MEKIMNRIGNGWLTHNYYSHWRSIFLEGWNWSVCIIHSNTDWMSMFLPAAPCDITKKKEKAAHFQFDFPMWGIQNTCCLHKYSLPIWIWWIIKRDSNIYIIFGAFKSTIYREESYTLPWDSYLTLMAPGSCTSTHARFRFYS